MITKVHQDSFEVTVICYINCSVKHFIVHISKTLQVICLKYNADLGHFR